MSASTQRWLARAVLVLLAIGAAYAVWLIPTGTKDSIGIWPVHSRHVFVLFAVALIWVAVAFNAIRFGFLFVYVLWQVACGRTFRSQNLQDRNP